MSHQWMRRSATNNGWGENAEGSLHICANVLALHVCSRSVSRSVLLSVHSAGRVQCGGKPAASLSLSFLGDAIR